MKAELKRCVYFLAAWCLTAAPLVVKAQAGQLPDSAREIPASSSAEVMKRPIGLTNLAGYLHQRVSTDSAEAQAYYDQGLAYLHSYVWVDAARSFHEALRRDPDLAMAHLGLAKSYTGATAYKDAFLHVDRALELSSEGRVGAIERKWIELGRQQLEAIFSSPEERSSKHRAYKDAVDELIVMDPEDPHAWVLRGNAEESRASGRGQGGRIGSVAYYESALARDPNHFGAHHYLIHSYEGLGLYEKSGLHAQRYAAAVPGVPHAQHMYGHVLPRLGRWETALSQFRKADDLQRAYFSGGIAPVEEWHHGHNIHVMGAVLLRNRDYPGVEELFQEAFHLEVRSVRDGRFVDPWLQYLLLRGRFEEVLEAAIQAEKRPLALARLIGAVRAAEAHLGLDQVEQAREAQQRALKAFEAFRRETSNPVFASLQTRYQSSLLEPLEAQLALRGDQPEAGEKVLVALADRYAESRTLDGWVTGLFHLEQLADAVDRIGRQDLAGLLRQRILQIDPEFPL